VALLGPRANDTSFTIFFAALVPAAFILLLRRLRALGLSKLTPVEDLVLAGLLAFGTVFFFSAVQGSVWFTAHVIGVLLAILHVWAAVGASRPVLAGLFLGLAFVTRTPMLFMFPLFLFEAWRAGREGFVRRVLMFAAPVAVIGIAAALYNHARFGEFTEFGHSYLNVMQQAQIEKYGLFSPRYLGRNLSVALTLLPDLSSKAPYVSISGHGLAMWVTTPVLLYLLWPREQGPLHRPLWASAALVAAWSLFYQNSGWQQFGYRFSLDYVVLLLTLLAVGGRRPSSRVFQGLAAAAVAVNLFGAITFNRAPKYYRTDKGNAGSAYQCVVPN
jgi:hypothetical protein